MCLSYHEQIAPTETSCMEASSEDFNDKTYKQTKDKRKEGTFNMHRKASHSA